MKQLFTIIALGLCSLAFSQDYLQKGEQLKDFTFQTLDGAQVNIEDLKGKVVYINFFATWCQPCIKELGLMEEQLLSTINDDDFYFVALGRGHTAEELKRFKAEKGYNFLIGMDTDKTLFKRFSEKGIPLNVIVDQDGEIIYNENGFSIASFKKIRRKIKMRLWF